MIALIAVIKHVNMENGKEFVRNVVVHHYVNHRGVKFK
tara:strand:- start:40 stop:153 length:114 start_codon:yes stop_codon:yes gene_type:complete